MTNPAVEGPAGGPVLEDTRIDAIDVLRGFALLGILVMNVQLFAMPDAAYFNPTACGDIEGANLAIGTATLAVGTAIFAGLQTVICTTIFYGHGLGYYGSVDRSGQLGVVIGVWAVQLIASPLWLRRYRFGPAEWVWRSLTYGTRPPFRRTTTLAP